MTACRICGTGFEPFLDFGPMPIANGFVREAVPDEYRFRLAVGRCTACGMVQLVEQPDPRMMFHESYAYFSSTSRGMVDHFRRFAEGVRSNALERPDPFVVEIGSNDGILLQHFAGWGVRHLGVEPSKNVAEEAQRKGVRTINRFFDRALARTIRETDGPADAVLAANVMCHIPDLHAVAEGVAQLLAPKGVLIFEDPYLGDILEKTAYDQIYDEHVFYFALSSLDRLFAQHGLEVVDVAPQPVHGGSMRYTVARRGERPVAPAVEALRRREREQGLATSERYDAFRQAVESSRKALIELLDGVRAKGQRVVGYGATSKSTTVTNYCGITPDHVEFICDTTPTKQGRLSPGAHIPIRPPEAFRGSYPEYALLFAWNHGEEIRAKETEFVRAGGRWITYVPRVQVLP